LALCSVTTPGFSTDEVVALSSFRAYARILPSTLLQLHLGMDLPSLSISMMRPTPLSAIIVMPWAAVETRTSTRFPLFAIHRAAS
jgi:hypothetical protein